MTLLLAILATSLLVSGAVIWFGTRPAPPLQFPPRARVFPFVMMHWDGIGGHRGGAAASVAGACGGPAFLVSVKPELGRAASSSEIAHLDGRPMERYCAMVCDSCGGKVRPMSVNVIPLADVPDRRMGAAS